jgi:O-antigen/teichoic acid export membrane protein
MSELRDALSLNLLRSIGALGVARALGIIFGFGTTIVWTRLMPPDTFGEFKVVVAAITFVSGFCLLGTAQAAIMAAAKNHDGSLAPLLRHKLMANVLGGVALLAIAAYYALWPLNAKAVAYGLIAAAFLFPLYNTSDVWMYWANGKSRFGEVALGQTISAALSLAAIFAAALFEIGDLWAIVVIYFTALTAINIAMLGRSLARRANSSVDFEAIAFGRHATVAMMFTSLLSLDVIIVNHFYSPQVVAEYVIALQFPDQLKGVLGLLAQVVAPRLYAANSLAESWQDMRRPFLLLCGAMVLVGVAGFFMLPPLTTWLFTERYADAAEYGKWLWLSLACTNPITTYIGTALIATKKPIFLYGPHVGYSLLLVALYFALVHIGLGGMVMARIVASVCLAGFYILAFVYLRNQDLRSEATPA